MWAIAKKRHQMAQPVNRLLVKHAQKSGYKHVSPVMKHMLKNFWTNVGQSVVCENAFNVMKNAPATKSRGRYIAFATKFHQVRRERLLSGRYKYTEVEAKPFVRGMFSLRKRRERRQSVDQVHKPSLEQLSDQKYRKISSTSATPHYSSWNATSWASCFTEAALMQECEKQKTVGEFEKSWLSGLLEEGMLVRRTPDSPWMFSMGEFGLGTVLWPAVEIKINAKESAFAPSTTAKKDDLLVVGVMDIGWEVQPVTHMSPARLRAKKWGAPLMKAMCVAKDGEPTTLLKYNASLCFRKLPRQWLQRLETHLFFEARGAWVGSHAAKSRPAHLGSIAPRYGRDLVFAFVGTRFEYNSPCTP